MLADLGMAGSILRSFRLAALLCLLLSQPLRGVRQAAQKAPGASRVTGGSKNALLLDCDWVLQFDGGSRGNPGMGGCGAVLFAKESSGELQEVWYRSSYVGDSGITNNVAEYQGLIDGLKQGVKMKIPSLAIQGDSELILRQVQGIYQVRNDRLKLFHAEARKLLTKLPSKSFAHIPRAQNSRADELCNIAMDRRGSEERFRPEYLQALERQRAKGASDSSTSTSTSASSSSPPSDDASSTKKSARAEGHLKRSRLTAKEKTKESKKRVANAGIAGATTTGGGAAKTKPVELLLSHKLIILPVMCLPEGGGGGSGGKRCVVVAERLRSPGNTGVAAMLSTPAEQMSVSTVTVGHSSHTTVSHYDSSTAAPSDPSESEVGETPAPLTTIEFLSHEMNPSAFARSLSPLSPNEHWSSNFSNPLLAHCNITDSSLLDFLSKNKLKGRIVSRETIWAAPPLEVAAASASVATHSEAAAAATATAAATAATAATAVTAAAIAATVAATTAAATAATAKTEATAAAVVPQTGDLMSGSAAMNATIVGNSTLGSESYSGAGLESVVDVGVVWGVKGVVGVVGVEVAVETSVQNSSVYGSSHTDALAPAAAVGEADFVHSNSSSSVGGEAAENGTAVIDLERVNSGNSSSGSVNNSSSVNSSGSGSGSSNVNSSGRGSNSTGTGTNSSFIGPDGEVDLGTPADKRSQDYLFFDQTSSVTTYVVELESPAKALKAIGRINEKAASSKLKASLRKARVRSPSKNLVNRGLVQLLPLPLDSLVQHLKRESYSGKAVDSFLFSWALGCSYGSILSQPAPPPLPPSPPLPPLPPLPTTAVPESANPPPPLDAAGSLTVN